MIHFESPLQASSTLEHHIRISRMFWEPSRLCLWLILPQSPSFFLSLQESNLPHALCNVSVYSFFSSILSSGISCSAWIFNILQPVSTVKELAIGQTGKWKTHKHTRSCIFQCIQTRQYQEPKGSLCGTTTMVGLGERRRTVTYRNSRKASKGIWAEY